MPLPSTEILAHIQEGLILRVVAQMKPFLFAYATMNYKQTYDQLIEKRRRNPLSKSEGYCEKHHIVPKSEGGTDDKSNLVNLTAREHYIAHLLLAKIYNDYKMWFALRRMCYVSDNHERDYKISSRTYGMLKRHISDSLIGRKLPEATIRKMSETHRRLGTKPPSPTGKRWFNNGAIETYSFECPEGYVNGRLPVGEETRQKMSRIMKSRPPIKLKPLSQEHKRKLSQHFMDTRWYNDGTIEVRSKKCPKGFIEGRLNTISLKPPSPAGKIWFNNGKVETYAFTCPEGFVKGRLKRNGS